MFCVNCGAKLEESWKVCPNCGTEVVQQQNNKPIIEEETVQKDVKENLEAKKFEFEGFRRTGRFGFQYLKSEVEVNDDKIHVVIHKKKEKNVIFSKQQISEVKFHILPVIGPMDIFRILLFMALMFVSKGMAIFAVLFFVKITLVRHMQITLNDGQKIAIPIRQKAETVELLKVIGYPDNEIQNIAASAISDGKIAIREWIVSTLMLVLAATTIVIGMETYISDRDANNTNSIEQDETVRTMEEVGGYEAWVESEYASIVRTDIVVTLPITEREADTYAVQVGTSLGDVIYIKQDDGALATEWDWLINAVPDIEGGDTATFQATLTIDGYAASDGEKPVPIFIAGDIEAYVNQESIETDTQNNAEINESANLSYDLFQDAENDLLYTNVSGQITDRNGNVISEYSGYSITDNGYVYEIESDCCLEGIMIDENGKLFTFVPDEVTTEINYIDNLVHDLGYVNNNAQRYIYFTHREGDALYFGIYDANDIDILRNCPAEIVDSTTLRYSEPDYGYDLTITILDQYSFSVTGTIDDEYTTGIYYITSYWN